MNPEKNIPNDGAPNITPNAQKTAVPIDPSLNELGQNPGSDIAIPPLHELQKSIGLLKSTSFLSVQGQVEAHDSFIKSCQEVLESLQKASSENKLEIVKKELEPFFEGFISLRKIQLFYYSEKSSELILIASLLKYSPRYFCKFFESNYSSVVYWIDICNYLGGHSRAIEFLFRAFPSELSSFDPALQESYNLAHDFLSTVFYDLIAKHKMDQETIDTISRYKEELISLDRYSSEHFFPLQYHYVIRQITDSSEDSSLLTLHDPQAFPEVSLTFHTNFIGYPIHKPCNPFSNRRKQDHGTLDKLCIDSAKSFIEFACHDSELFFRYIKILIMTVCQDNKHTQGKVDKAPINTLIKFFKFIDKINNQHCSDPMPAIIDKFKRLMREYGQLIVTSLITANISCGIEALLLLKNFIGQEFWPRSIYLLLPINKSLGECVDFLENFAKICQKKNLSPPSGFFKKPLPIKKLELNFIGPAGPDSLLKALDNADNIVNNRTIQRDKDQPLDEELRDNVEFKKYHKDTYLIDPETLRTVFEADELQVSREIALPEQQETLSDDEIVANLLKIERADDYIISVAQCCQKHNLFIKKIFQKKSPSSQYEVLQRIFKEERAHFFRLRNAYPITFEQEKVIESLISIFKLMRSHAETPRILLSSLSLSQLFVMNKWLINLNQNLIQRGVSAQEQKLESQQSVFKKALAAKLSSLEELEQVYLFMHNNLAYQQYFIDIISFQYIALEYFAQHRDDLHSLYQNVKTNEGQDIEESSAPLVNLFLDPDYSLKTWLENLHKAYDKEQSKEEAQSLLTEIVTSLVSDKHDIEKLVLRLAGLKTKTTRQKKLPGLLQSILDLNKSTSDDGPLGDSDEEIIAQLDAEFFDGYHHSFRNTKTSLETQSDRLSRPFSRNDTQSPQIGPASLPYEAVVFQSIEQRISQASQQGCSSHIPVREERDHTQYRLYLASGATLSPENALSSAVVVFGMTGIHSLVPESSDEQPVFIILTRNEFETINKDPISQGAMASYHFIVVEKIWDISSDENLILSDVPFEEACMSVFRRVALLLAYDYNIKQLLMLSDRLQSLHVHHNLLQTSSTPKWAHICNTLLSEAEKYQAIISSVAASALSQQSKLPAEAFPQKKLGSDLFVVNMTQLKAVLTERDQLYFLLPPGTTPSLDDVFFQYAVQLFANNNKSKSSSAKSQYLTLPSEYFFVKYRTQQNSPKHAAQSKKKSIIQPIKKLPFFCRVAEKFFERKLAMLFMSALIFYNHHLNRKNQALAESSNKFRSRDLGDVFFRNRQNNNTSSTVTPEIPQNKNFKELLAWVSENMSSEKGQALRPAQKQCLAEISKQIATREKSFISSMPTGAGKTLVQAITGFSMLHAQPYHHIVVVAPNISLSSQLSGEFAKTTQLFQSNIKNRVVPVSSGNNACPMKTLIENYNILDTSQQGLILTFCQRSFENMLALALKDGEDPTEEIKNTRAFFSRLSLLLFDESHDSCSNSMAGLLRQLNEKNLLNSLENILGFSATPRCHPDFEACFPLKKHQPHPFNRELIFYQSPQEAQQQDIIRPLQTMNIQARSLSSVLKETYHLNGEPLENHVGMIICKNTKELLKTATQLTRELKGLKIFSIYQKNPNCMADIEAFKKTSEKSLALVVRMLQAGFDHPAVDYTISLKEKMSSVEQVQRSGRCRRKIAGQNEHGIFLFFSKRESDIITASATNFSEHNELPASYAELSDDEQELTALGKRSLDDSDDDSISYVVPRSSKPQRRRIIDDSDTDEDILMGVECSNGDSCAISEQKSDNNLPIIIGCSKNQMIEAQRPIALSDSLIGKKSYCDGEDSRNDITPLHVAKKPCLTMSNQSSLNKALSESRDNLSIPLVVTLSRTSSSDLEEGEIRENGTPDSSLKRKRDS